MDNTYHSWSPCRWDCKYPVVFVPKRRRKALSGEWRKQLGPIFHELARQKECQISDGHLMTAQVRICIAMAPKLAVFSLIGFWQGKSAIAVARMPGKERNYSGEAFWARGYAVSMVGCNEEQIRRYIREQEGADGEGRF